MPPHTSAAARRGHGGARLGGSRAVPHHPRRMSGPAGGIARPVAVPGGAVAAPRRQRTGAFERLRALPEHRLLDRLLRGRAWIWVVGILLGGIVAMQVSLLKMNAAISHDVQRASILQRDNASMQADIAQLASGDRVQAAATAAGMVDPPAGDVRYLWVRPGYDAGLAARRMTAPSAAAQALMANGGHVPGAVAAADAAAAAGTMTPSTTTATTTPATTTPTTTTATPTPTTTATTAPTTVAPAATPAPQG